MSPRHTKMRTTRANVSMCAHTSTCTNTCTHTHTLTRTHKTFLHSIEESDGEDTLRVYLPPLNPDVLSGHKSVDAEEVPLCPHALVCYRTETTLSPSLSPSLALALVVHLCVYLHVPPLTRQMLDIASQSVLPDTGPTASILIIVCS